MPVAVREEVEAILDTFTERLRAVLDRAMDDWSALPNKSWLMFSRDRSTILFSYIIRRALEEFQVDPDIHIVREPQTVKFLFRDSVLVRFKKGNGKGVGSNIETQAVLQFIDPQLSFAGLPNVNRVEIVYQLDILGTGYAEVSVVARDKNTRVWAYPLTAKPSAEIIPLPPRVPPVFTPPAVTLKRPAQEDRDGQAE
jgi:hypothetical protein